jgi:hypothetical protein
MSNVHIKRVVENIRSNTTVYTPIVEMIVNGIQAVDEAQRADGKVQVRVQRSGQVDIEAGLADVVGFEVEDNGVGFTDAHRDSFDTLYTDRKISEGGKGFGRFTSLKYFEDLRVVSIFRQDGGFKRRCFSMGKKHEIIVREQVESCDATDIGSVVTLETLLKARSLDKKLSTIARNLAERLLPYFISDDYRCPDIVPVCVNRFTTVLGVFST